MPLQDLYRAIRDYSSSRANSPKLAWRLSEVLVRTWDLGFTAFGGPPVHFQILYGRFVEGIGAGSKWIDEQTYQELFAICQALPGPASTKLLFCIALIHAGLLPAILAFVLWSLPGAIGMYCLSLGVQKMPDRLPSIVYALLSGLNASTVGIVALAAVQLAEKAIRDKITRILVIFGACAGLCYNALWYFPVLIAIGGTATLIWDVWLQQKIGKIKAAWNRRRREQNVERNAEENHAETIAVEQRASAISTTAVQRRTQPGGSGEHVETEQANTGFTSSRAGLIREDENGSEHVEAARHGISIKIGISTIAGFVASFIVIMALRGSLSTPPLPLSLFSNMYLAGTIIFGGGPVVIPLLREYVVGPGWVSPRDFLLGLAIIQAFPGPNFNFSVYLGALVLSRTNIPTIFGALLAFVGIFTPGLTLSVGIQSFWQVLRTKSWVISLLRGINATAVGLVFTAVYRLWEIGYLTPESSDGKSLAGEPWWVVVAAVTYAESAWFGVPPAAAILLGAVLGLGWYGAVGR